MPTFARHEGAARTVLALVSLTVGACSTPPDPTSRPPSTLTPPPATVTERRAAVALPLLPDPPRGLGSMTARVPGTTDVVGGVRLATHHATVTIEQGIAHTVVEEEFRNDTGRVLEGRLLLPLPADATLARLALWVGSTLVEGEVVERRRAGLIFRGIVDDTVRPRDPALLDVVAGGKVSLRIFPLPAHGSRKVVFAYDEVLRRVGGQLHYVHPLSQGGDRATQIDSLRVTVNGVLRLDARDTAPTSDVVVPVSEAPPPVVAGTSGRGESAVVVRTLAEATGDVKPFSGDVALALDTSEGQTGASLAAQIHLASAIIADLGAHEAFVILACDTACKTYPTVGRAQASEATIDEARTFLAALEARGASDPAGALVAAARRLDADSPGQIVLVSDGSATAGELSVDAQLAHAKPLVDGFDVRVIGAGRAVDDRSLSALARGLGATYDRVATGAPLTSRVTELAATRRSPVVRAPSLNLPAGATDPEPSAPMPTRAGEEVIVFARAATPVEGAPTTGAPVPKMWARERVAELETRGAEADPEIAKLAVKHHLLSRATSLLVLENDRMFAEFGIARTQQPADPEIAFASGGAEGFGRLSGSHMSRAPQVRMGMTTVSGRLPPEVIQRIVRQNFGRFRLCYEQGLRKDPSLSGRVVARFVLGRDGNVASVADGGSDLADASVISCVLDAFRGLSFPEPEGGTVTVIYPLTFASEGGGGGGSPAETTPRPLPVSPPRSRSDMGDVPRLPRNSALNPPPYVPPPPEVPSVAHRAGDDRWLSAPAPIVDTMTARVARAPEKRRGHLDLVRTALSSGRFDDAYAAARTLVSLDPDLAEGREALAESAAALGRADEAVRAMESASALDPRSAPRQLAAARAAWAMGDATRACAHLRALGELSSKEHAARGEACRTTNTVTLPDGARGGVEATVTCASAECSVVALVTPAGRVLSPWTQTRAATLLSHGTYRTVLLSGPRAGDVTVQALGSVFHVKWIDGAEPRTLAITDVRLPAPRRRAPRVRW